MQPPPRQRRALSATGPVSAVGSPADRQLVKEALDVPADADPRAFTHGFHSYPARFHPHLCRRLLAELPRGATVLDPFVGSGTSLVEAALRGARTIGVDINPLALELSWLKATRWAAADRARLLASAQAIAERSSARVRRRARTRTAGTEYDDPQHYAAHVFRELVGLREEIDAEQDPKLHRALLLLLSSILVKVSRQPSETAAGQLERAIGKGLPSRLYGRKAEELVERLAAFAALAPSRVPAPTLYLADARRLDSIEDRSIDVVLTSPPYVGTYDYADQHARRLGWLGLDRSFEEGLEIGSRRRARSAEEPLATWQQDVDAVVGELARVLRAGGSAFVVIGDSAVGRHRIPGDAAIRKAAASAGLVVRAAAAQERPGYYAEVRAPTRTEHLLWLEHR